MPDIIHFTTVHPRTDTRIRVKQVATLARELDENVALYVQDGQGDERDEKGGFDIHDTGARPKSRLSRMVKGGWRMYRAVRRARPKIAQFHDPELIPWGVLLSFSGIKVIYDSHEDLAFQILHKGYLPSWSRKPLAWMSSRFESLACKAFAGAIAVMPFTAKRFMCKNTIIVTNYPSLDEFSDLKPEGTQSRDNRFIYVGGITRVRGVCEMVDAIEKIQAPDSTLALLGSFSPASLEEENKAKPGWAHVDFKGWSPRDVVAFELGRARVGLVLLHPTPQYVQAYPVKMFEYMAAGLPVIASDFPLWKEIFDEIPCGIQVDPRDPEAIARAMDWMLTHPEEATEMGRLGRKAIEEIYNWGPEGEKLVALYRALLS